MINIIDEQLMRARRGCVVLVLDGDWMMIYSVISNSYRIATHETSALIASSSWNSILIVNRHCDNEIKKNKYVSVLTMLWRAVTLQNKSKIDKKCSVPTMF